MSRLPFWHPVFWRLALSIWLVYLFHFRHLAAGSERFVVLVQSLVERGMVDVTYYAQIPFYQAFLIDIVTYGDRTLINTNPGLSFLAAPMWALVYFFYRLLPPDTILRHEEIHYFCVHFISFAVTAALLSALSAWLLASFTYRRSQSLRRAVFAALLYSFGSIAFFFSTRLNQNIAIAFVTTAVFVLLFEPEVLGLRSCRWQLAAIGFLLGWGWFIDVTVLPFAVAVSGYLLWHYRQSLAQLGYGILGALPPLSGQLLYNTITFGNPLLPTTAMIARFEAVRTEQAGFGVSGLDWQSIGIYLFGAEAGFFIYMPYALLSLFYGLREWRERQRLRPVEKLVLVLSSGLYLLFIGTIPATYLYSLFGPRYLLPLVPFACLAVSLYLRRRELQLAAVLVGLGFAINLAGAQLGNDTGNVWLTLGVYLVKGPWLPILDWVQSDLAALTGFSPSFVNPLGLMLALTFCLGAIWLPYWLQGRAAGTGRG